jgi:hypothetical protein
MPAFDFIQDRYVYTTNQLVNYGIGALITLDPVMTK